MQVILMEKIGHLGALGDQVNVKPGYARNYLLPQKKAVQANAANIAKFEAQRAELEKTASELFAAAQKRADALAGVNVSIAAKASDEGKLFGSITLREIKQALKEKGVEIDKKELVMSGNAIRTVGEHEIFVQLHTDIRIPLKVNVVSDK
ncbi:MAG: rplI [Gammaproteobacteria bacterium]|jgi:large subunit ribosomal protein L9|nr:rplI [Gammaproteobacteria bacterium]